MYLDRQRLDGRIAFITGGARGIGLCTAQALLEAGARVVIADLTQDEIDAGRAKLANLGYAAEGVVLDVTDASACTEVAERVSRDIGPVDILIANAGIALPDAGGEDTTDAAWLKVMDVNVNGVFWSCRAFGARHAGSAARDRSSRWGRCRASSPTGRSARPTTTPPRPPCTRWSVRSPANGPTRGVRVNCVAPTYVKTAMTDGFGQAQRLSRCLARRRRR